MSGKFLHRKKRILSIKSGETVIVISGKDKGNIGKVLSVDRKNERILIEGINFVTRHVKSNTGNREGGKLRSEAPIHYSNVQRYNHDLGRGVRTRVQISESGDKKHLCVKTSSVLG